LIDTSQITKQKYSLESISINNNTSTTFETPQMHNIYLVDNRHKNYVNDLHFAQTLSTSHIYPQTRILNYLLTSNYDTFRLEWRKLNKLWHIVEWQNLNIH